MIKNNYSCLEKRALHNIEIQKIPGCVCLVATPGNVIYHEAFGFEDYTAKKPMAKNSMFRLASMTKAVTGVTAMTLVEKGLIEERGRLELPGKPLLYGTTKNFLRCFSLSDLSELPPLPKDENTERDIGEQLEIEDTKPQEEIV